MTDVAWMPKAEPHLPPWGSQDNDIVHAVRAMRTGTANACQQQLAWKYLMFVTGASEDFADMPYRPDDRGGRRATDFALGKLFVGQQIRKLLRPEYTPQSKLPAAPPPTVQKRLRQRAGKRAA